MARLALKSVVLVAALALAGEAAAADQLFRKTDATPLTDTVIGQPFWTLQAQCAGLFGAMSNYQSQNGRPAEAERSKQIAVGFMTDALTRLQADRGIDRKAAMAIALPQLDVGRAHGRDVLADGRIDSLSAWNAERSFCLDINDAYHRRK